MKTRALAVNVTTKKEKVFTAFDAVYLREFNNSNFKDYKFYYVDNYKQLYELIPKFIKEKNTAFFAFKSGNRPEIVTEDEGESLTHFAAKKALARLKELRLIDIKTKTEILLNVKNGENEKRFDFSNPYYTDVYYEIDNKQNKDMKKYIYKWYEQLVIEIFVSHEVTKEKASTFESNNVPIFEVKIPKSTRDKFELESQIGLSKYRIDKAINNMQRMFKKGIRGIFVSDPESEEYKTMCKYKEKIEKFKKAKDKVEQEYLTSIEQLELAKNELRDVETKLSYYNSLEDRVAELEEIIASNKKHPIKFIISNIKNKDE